MVRPINFSARPADLLVVEFSAAALEPAALAEFSAAVGPASVLLAA